MRSRSRGARAWPCCTGTPVRRRPHRSGRSAPCLRGCPGGAGPHARVRTRDAVRRRRRNSTSYFAEYERLSLHFEVAGGYDIEHRTDDVLTGLGFTPEQIEPAGPDAQRRPEDASGAGQGAALRARPAAAGRADQPPRPGHAGVAGGVSARPGTAPSSSSPTTAISWTG